MSDFDRPPHPHLHRQRAINPPPRRREAPVPSMPPPMQDTDDPPKVATYEVGYGKPPLHTRFQKGKSGNPKGKVKGSENVSTVYREVYNEKITLKTPKGPKKVSVLRALVMKQRAIALQGSLAAIDRALLRYERAVPDLPDSLTPDTATDFTETDFQMLAELRAQIQAELGEGS